MIGAQDLGGRAGFGAVAPEQGEPVFHAAWERRVLGFTVAMGASGAWTGDQSRHKREQLPADFYWTANYYDIWLTALTQLLEERGMVTERDLAAGHAVDAARPPPRVLKAENVAAVLTRGFPYLREARSPAAFAVGDTVRTIRNETPGHTRLPAYAMERNGVIEAVRGCHVFPDSNGMGQGEDPRWLYTVRFSAKELWGDDRPDSICLDLWEPYLVGR
ncbi:MAG: nitrile hydratase subunit beta [Rhizobiales bacterium]|nr:nitrile hydratase subunit beta [Hyphomicrobiales bacterium]